MLYLKKKNLLKCVNNFKDFILTSIRYKHVKLCINHSKSNHLKKFNILAYILGCISCLGISIVGNFQKNKTDIHFAGAFIAFFGLYFYCAMQTFLSYKLSFVMYSSKFIFIFRVVLVSLCLIISLLGNWKFFSFFFIISINLFNIHSILKKD